MIWIIKLAWRNLWRNRRRTLLTALALGLSVLMMSLALGLMDAMMDKVVRTATLSRLGHAQIHDRDYAATFDETKTIANAEQWLKRVRQASGVKHATARVVSVGLLAIADRSQGVQVLGVDPIHEKGVTAWQDRLKGRYLKGPGEVLLGVEVAKKLDVEVDSKVVMTVANVHTGEPTTELLRVVGVLSSGDAQIDKGVAIITLPRAQAMMGLPDAAHEISIITTAPSISKLAIEQVIAPLRQDKVVVRPWHEINKMVSQALLMQEKWMGVFVVIVFILISFGIVNTIAMSLLERTREFGVMRAVGTEPKQMFGLIVAEAAWLGIVGAMPGAVLGIGLCALLSQKGLHLTSASAYGVSFKEPLFIRPDVWGTLEVALIFTCLTILTSVVSAWRAARLKPVDALRA